MSQHILPNEWQFWLIVSSPGSSYQIEEIIKVSTAQNFFRYYYAIPKMNELSDFPGRSVSIALFRDSIKPAWEDKRNSSGGTYNFVYNNPENPNPNDDWLELLLMIIGKTLQKCLNNNPNRNENDPINEINGIVGGYKKKVFTISIWTSHETTKTGSQALVNEVVGTKKHFEFKFFKNITVQK